MGDPFEGWCGVSVSVAIIGHAWRTPLGHTINGVLERLRAGDRAACASPRAAGYACSIVAPIPDEPSRSRQSRFLRRMGLFGLEVAREAFANAKATPAFARAIGGASARSHASDERAHESKEKRANASDEHAPAEPVLNLGDRIGLFAGVGGLRAHWDDMLKALADQADDGANAWERGLREVHPYWMLRHLSNNVHALAAMELGLRGEGATYGGATGGTQAIAAAARALADGAIDVALVVAYDSLLEPETLVELGAKRAATRETALANLAPAYDPGAAGFVPGEAAGALVLVRAEDAPDRIQIAAADSGDGSRDQPSPQTLARALRAVLHEVRGARHAGSAAISMVDGAGRAWPDLDAEECGVLAELVQCKPTALTSAFGQLGAATSVIQAIALGAMLERGRTALALTTGAPGLVGALRVECPT